MSRRRSSFRIKVRACIVGLTAVLISSAPARAEYDEGDIVESAAATELKVESQVVYTTRRGERLAVERAQDGWLWVKADGGQEAWISEDDVRPPTGPYTFPKTSITIPEIPGLSREVYRYPQVELGTMVTFFHDGWYASVYVYDLGQTNIPDGHESKIVEAQLKQAIGDIRGAEEKGRYSNVVELASGIIPLGENARARWASFQLEEKGISRYSEIYLTARQVHFIKLRIS